MIILREKQCFRKFVIASLGMKYITCIIYIGLLIELGILVVGKFSCLTINSLYVDIR